MRRAGISERAIERIPRGSTASGWSRHEAAIVCGIDELVLDQTLHEQTYTTLREKWSEEQMIAYLMLAGHYVATAFIQNSLRVRLSPDNPGLVLR
jgi:4-carboxymuconolactone decarboxylase